MSKDDKSNDNKNLDKLKKSRNKGDKHMENVIDLQKDKCTDYSIEKMIMDPEYRDRVRKYFDDNYKETSEEKEIFESWRKNRIRRHD